MNESEIVKIYNDGINAVVSLVKGLNVQISDLAKQIDTLNQRITELEARVNKNSSNSILKIMLGHFQPSDGEANLYRHIAKLFAF